MNDRAADIHANYVYALGRIGRLGPDGESEQVGPMLCINAGIGVSRFNIAVAVSDVTDARRAVRDATEWFGTRGLNFRLDLRGKTDTPLIAAATVEKFQFWWREPMMLLEPLPLPLEIPPELELADVLRPEDRDLYCQVDAEEYSDQAVQLGMISVAAQLPGVSLHLGMATGEPLARSMAIRTGDLVGVHNVYVAPSHRRKGYGAAITAAAMEAGRKDGATAACLQSTEAAFSLYQKMGFQHVDDYIVMGIDEPRLP
jgi:GNAT superfamily N-acetyltransferase